MEKVTARVRGRRRGRGASALGLHLGQQGWYLQELEQAADGSLLLRCVGQRQPVVPEAPAPQAVVERALELQAWIAACGVATPDVAAGLPRRALRLWHMRVAAGLEEDDVEHLVRMEAQGRHGLPPDVWCLDFGVVQETDGQTELLVAAARQAEVAYWQSLAHSAGLKLQVLEVLPHAVQAAVLRAWHCQVVEPRGWHGIVMGEEDEGVALLWLRDGVLQEERRLELLQLSALGEAVRRACQERRERLDGLWLALDERAEAAVSGLQHELQAVLGPEAEVQWLHPWAGMQGVDARWRAMPAAAAGAWWGACGLALRGVHAWSR